MRVLSARHLVYWLAPRRWPEAARRLRGARAGAAWCAHRSVSNAEALAGLGLDVRPNSFETEFPELISEARRRVIECPHRLGGSGNLDLLFALCRTTGARRVVETGVAYGWSSLAILLALAPEDDALLCSTDLAYAHLGMANEAWVGVAVPAELRARWKLFRGPDREVLPDAIAAAAPLDLAHYDSDKSTSGRRWAYEVLWEALRPGGILVSDDVQDNLAFRDFSVAVGIEPVVVQHEGKYQGILRRPEGSS